MGFLGEGEGEGASSNRNSITVPRSRVAIDSIKVVI
jgi:hypothetical protein